MGGDGHSSLSMPVESESLRGPRQRCRWLVKCEMGVCDEMTPTLTRRGQSSGSLVGILDCHLCSYVQVLECMECPLALVPSAVVGPQGNLELHI